ncbi:MAG: FecR domain-containing protein [Bacteroidetes bacterium]|nr:FecR domain-containing protein [Bacteroidota bacterium]
MYRSFSSADELKIAASGKISEFTLPDGTKVTLNNGATLTYPSKFTGGFRKISLNGEAWFEVAHDRAHPFVVNAGKTVIQVLGTSFSVNTKGYRNCREIILAAGKVKVYRDDKPDDPVFLSPGEKASVPADGQPIIKSVNDDENFLAWKTKHIIFSNTSMNEAAALLSKVYDVRIRFSDNRLSGCKITATFDKQSLESVLNVIKVTLDLQVRYAGRNIELSGAGCN